MTQRLFGIVCAGMASLAVFSACSASPPKETVNLVFVHHSCGENLLADDNGGIGRLLSENNYFVSDTNYGWGPDGIGDRTNIPDWREWFAGASSEKILDALYNETERHSDYTRRGKRAPGENRIIMFKSCFPNSALEGPRNAAPKNEGDRLSVANAKDVYNTILKYFATRPDKLFIVLTAPPLRDKALAANARAFNRWLVKEWLKDYPLKNVAVFDFHCVLTHPDNHHRRVAGKTEYADSKGDGTLYYPSDDDHPSKKGNEKAAKELVSLINHYYARWMASNPPTAPKREKTSPTTPKKPATPAETAEPEKHAEKEAPSVAASNILDDFESPSEWSVFKENAKTSIAFERVSDASGGERSMEIRFDVPKGATPAFAKIFDTPVDKSKTAGISLFFKFPGKKTAGIMVVAYQGDSPDSLALFETPLDAKPATARNGWMKISIPWKDFKQPEWQGDPSKPFDTRKTIGFGIVFDANTAPMKGTLRLDQITFAEK